MEEGHGNMMPSTSKSAYHKKYPVWFQMSFAERKIFMNLVHERNAFTNLAYPELLKEEVFWTQLSNSQVLGGRYTSNQLKTEAKQNWFKDTFRIKTFQSGPQTAHETEPSKKKKKTFHLSIEIFETIVRLRQKVKLDDKYWTLLQYENETFLSNDVASLKKCFYDEVLKNYKSFSKNLHANILFESLICDMHKKKKEPIMNFPETDDKIINLYREKSPQTELKKKKDLERFIEAIKEIENFENINVPVCIKSVKKLYLQMIKPFYKSFRGLVYAFNKATNQNNAILLQNNEYAVESKISFRTLRHSTYSFIENKTSDNIAIRRISLGALRYDFYQRFFQETVSPPSS